MNVGLNGSRTLDSPPPVTPFQWSFRETHGLVQRERAQSPSWPPLLLPFYESRDVTPRTASWGHSQLWKLTLLPARYVASANHFSSLSFKLLTHQMEIKDLTLRGSAQHEMRKGKGNG